MSGKAGQLWFLGTLNLAVGAARTRGLRGFERGRRSRCPRGPGRLPCLSYMQALEEGTVDGPRRRSAL